MRISTLLAAAIVSAVTLASCNKENGPGERVVNEYDVYLTSISADGVTADYDQSTKTFTLTAPTKTDFSKIDVSYLYSADEICADGVPLRHDGATLDLSKPVKISVTSLNVTKEYTLVARNTGLPIVRITTPGFTSVTSKTVWMSGASIRVEQPDGTVDYEGPMSIRGRGNSTWNYPKKPFALKLESKEKVLSMPKHKRWVLLANWKDRTLLRNDAAFWLSRQSGLDYTVRGQFVELEFNGKHIGNYYLCEQIKIDKNRVNVKDGGFLMELDTYYDEVNKFMSPYFNLPYQFKDPDEDALTSELFDYMRSYVTNLEIILKDESRVRNHEYEQYLDVDSAIDYMFINELANNTDYYGTWPFTGPHSCYMYKDVDGPLMTGPVWDFDYHAFVPGFSNQWVGAKGTLYYKALYKDEKFRQRMLEKWAEEKSKFAELPAYIDEMAEKIRLSESINHSKWPIKNNPENGDEDMTFEAAVKRMKDAFTKKFDWMDKNLKDLK